MNSEETRNLILAIVLSAIVLIGWNYLFAPKPRPVARRTAPVAAGTANPVANSPPRRRAAPQPPDASSRARTLSPPPPRVTIDAPGVGGSINLDGGEIDDVFLKGLSRDDRPQEPECRAVLARRRRRSPIGRRPASSPPTRRSRRRRAQTRWTSQRRRSDAEPSDHAHLRQRRGPRLHARDRGRRQIHVHRHRQGREQERQAGFAAPLRADPAARHAEGRAAIRCCTRALSA